MTRTEDADGYYTCERCGKRKLVGSRCTSCGEDRGSPPGADRPVPEGWNPQLTSSSRPRLTIVARPERGDAPDRGE